MFITFLIVVCLWKTRETLDLQGFQLSTGAHGTLITVEAGSLELPLYHLNPGMKRQSVVHVSL